MNILSIIVAMDENRVIGKDNKIPWHIPNDLKRFKRLTTGHPVIMGRKTYQSICVAIGKPLPNRINIVLTRHDTHELSACCTPVSSWEEALKRARVSTGGEETFIIGGAEIYKLALPHVDRIYLTRVHTIIPDGDTLFPKWNPEEWHDVVTPEHHLKDEKHECDYTFRVLGRS